MRVAAPGRPAALWSRRYNNLGHLDLGRGVAWNPAKGSVVLALSSPMLAKPARYGRQTCGSTRQGDRGRPTRHGPPLPGHRPVDLHHRRPSADADPLPLFLCRPDVAQDMNRGAARTTGAVLLRSSPRPMRGPATLPQNAFRVSLLLRKGWGAPA